MIKHICGKLPPFAAKNASKYFDSFQKPVFFLVILNILLLISEIGITSFKNNPKY